MSEIQRGVSQHVEDRVVGTVGGGVADWVLVHENPFIDRWDVVYDGHAGPLRVEIVGDVVDRWSPFLEVPRRLVG